MVRFTASYVVTAILVFSQALAQKPFLAFLTPDQTVWGEGSLIEDFRGSDINKDHWFNYYPWGGVSLDAKTYTDPNLCQQKNGFLVLSVDTVNQRLEFPAWMIDTAKARSLGMSTDDGKIPIERLTSALWSKQTFKYGFFECRCWLPAGKGYWPAFWMYGGKPNEELDFIEAKGERLKSYHVDVHCPNRCDRVRRWGVFDQPFGHWVKVGNLTGKWITVAGLWTPLGVVFYFNGEVVAQHEASFHTEMNLIANFSLAQDNGPFSPGPNRKTTFPQDFTIDYIRAWSIPEAYAVNSMETLKKGAYIRCLPEENNRIRFEFSNRLFSSNQRAWIEREGNPFIELDLSSSSQVLDYTYWNSGKYVLRIKNGEKVSEHFLLIAP
jgi:hypothetical protein